MFTSLLCLHVFATTGHQMHQFKDRLPTKKSGWDTIPQSCKRQRYYLIARTCANTAQQWKVHWSILCTQSHVFFSWGLYQMKFADILSAYHPCLHICTPFCADTSLITCHLLSSHLLHDGLSTWHSEVWSSVASCSPGYWYPPPSGSESGRWGSNQRRTSGFSRGGASHTFQLRPCIIKLVRKHSTFAK